MSIGEATVLMHAPDVVACKLDGGNALLDLASSDYYRLNSTAATIWDCIGGGSTKRQITDHLLSEYDIDREQCAADVDAIINALVEAGLVVVPD